jgi:hypothetical protein
MVTVFDTVEPLSGDKIFTVGGVLSFSTLSSQVVKTKVNKTEINTNRNHLLFMMTPLINKYKTI